MSAPQSTAERIAALNDAFRQSLGTSATIPGRLVATEGIYALGEDQLYRVLALVKQFADFSIENDPHGEHDFGSLEIDGATVFWKIDIYADSACEWGSEHPDTAHKSYRILTVMLASEY